jgi:hypothetical protein
MNTSTFRSAVLAVAILSTALTVAVAAGAQKEEAAVVTKLITAVEQADYDGFVGGAPTLRKLTKEQFAAVGALYGARLKRGYTITLLGELKQEGHRVSLWKIAFKDESDDALVTMSMKEGSVGGFFIR